MCLFNGMPIQVEQTKVQSKILQFLLYDIGWNVPIILVAGVWNSPTFWNYLNASTIMIVQLHAHESHMTTISAHFESNDSSYYSY